MKRISALMLLCLLAALFLPASAQAASSLVLPSGLREIEEEAFRCDTSIETVVLPETLNAIGANAFSDSGLRQIVIPASVESIADNAFDNCGGLEAVVTFDSYAYSWCVGHGVQVRLADEMNIGPGNITVSIGTGGAAARLCFVPAVSGSYTLSSSGADDTRVYLYDAEGTQLAYDDDGGDSTNFSLSYVFTADTVYFFEVGYFYPEKTGEIPLALVADFAPRISQQPDDVYTVIGEQISFTVSAAGTGTLRYQWQERADDSPAWQNAGGSGSTTDTLSFYASAAYDGSKFRCIVTDDSGYSACSREAGLYIVPSADPVYRALLIAEADYEGDEARPGNTVDVANMNSMLRNVHGPAGRAYTIYGGNNEYRNASPTRIMDLISSCFATAKSNDVSLFFISSHGVEEADGVTAGAIKTVDSSPDHRYYVSSSSFYSIPNHLLIDELAAALKAIPGKVIVIINTCGSGAGVYAASIVNGAVEEEFDPEQFSAQVIRAFANADEDGNEVVAQTGELRETNKFYVLTSSAHRESTWGYDETGGIFVTGIVNGIGSSGAMPADTNSDGCVALNELYHYTYTYTFNETKDDEPQHVQVYPEDSDYELFIR